MDTNLVILTGRLTNDPTLVRLGEKQTPCTKFSIASNAKFNDKETVEYSDIVVWGAQAEACHTHRAKGSMVLVKGRKQTREYVDKENVKRRVTEIIAQRYDGVEFLNGSKATAPAAAATASAPAISDDEIPF